MTSEEDLFYEYMNVCMGNKKQKKKEEGGGGAPIYEPWMMMTQLCGCLDWLVLYHNLMNATEMFVH